MTAVTLYNASFEEMGKVSFQQAVKMLFRQVAVVHEAKDDAMIGPHQWPTAVRLIRYVAAVWMYRPAHYTRGSVLVRDRHRCAYCGGHATTVDHILPASRGGKWSWLNNVAACRGCNHDKGNRTPEEAGMPLRFQPYVPTRAELAGARVR